MNDISDKIGEILQADDFRDEYRRRLEAVLSVAGDYDGTEGRYGVVVDAVADFEEWIKCSIHLEGGVRVPQDIEDTIAGVLQGLTVSGILDVASNSFSANINSVLDNLFASAVRVSKSFFPSGDQDHYEEGSSHETDRRPDARLAQLIVLLNKNGIYVDDIRFVVSDGPERSHSRNVPYVLVEIPKLRRQVLVCDEYKEGTYVVMEMFGRETFTIYPKDQLVSKYPEVVRFIPYRSFSQWRDDLLKYIFGKNQSSVEPDVLLAEKIRIELKKQMPTSKEWVIAGKHSVRRDMEVFGRKLDFIANCLGFEGNPYGRMGNWYRLGLLVYGDDDEYLNAMIKIDDGDVDFICSYVRGIMSAQEWFFMSINKADKFKLFDRWTLEALAKKIGLEVSDDRPLHHQLGDIFYKGDPDLARVSGLAGKNKEVWRPEIKKYYPTSESWCNMSRTDRFGCGFKICGLAMRAISTHIGVSGDPMDDYGVFLQMGFEIYGNDDQYLQDMWKICCEGDLEPLIIAIKRIVPTIEEWNSLSQEHLIQSIHVYGFAITAISSLFGLQLCQPDYRSFRAELGRKIFS